MRTLRKIERLVFACIILVAGTFVAMNGVAAGKIFKTVDAEGNVVFSDLPPRIEQSSETVKLEAPNIFTPQGAATQLPEGREPWITHLDGENDEPATSPSYRSLTINTPGNDSNVRENTGNVSVVVHLLPALHPGHSMRLLLDDVATASPGEDAVFALSNVDRGTHTLKAEVLDSDGTVIFTGNQSVFHLQRYSTLTAPNRGAN